MIPLEIKDFHLGIGESEFTGNGLVMNADTETREGMTRIALESLLTSTALTGTLDQPYWIVPNEARVNELWAVDNSNNVFRGTTSTSGSEAWSFAFQLSGGGAGGTGLRVWKDHLFVTGTASLYAYGPLSGSASLYFLRSIESNSSWHPMIVGQDDILYGGAGRYLFSLEEASGQDFQAGTAATYSWNAQALDLPEDYQVRCLAELGKYIMAGTWKGTNIQDFKIADIFPWDRTSDKTNLPIRVAETGIQAMVSKNNLLYFLAGTEGKLFETDGSEVEELAKIPEQINDLSAGAFVDTYPGAIIYHSGKILFGLSSGGNTRTAHVWSYNLENKALKIENTISSGTAQANRLTCLLSTGTLDYWIGYREDSGAGRIDHIQSGGSARRYTDYSCVVTSPYYQPSSKKNPVTISQIEAVLARPLASGQGVRLSYRTDTSASFTVVPSGTVDFTAYGATQGEIIPFRLDIKQGIQIRAELTTESGSSTSPELIKLLVS